MDTHELSKFPFFIIYYVDFLYELLRKMHGETLRGRKRKEKSRDSCSSSCGDRRATTAHANAVGGGEREREAPHDDRNCTKNMCSGEKEEER